MTAAIRPTALVVPLERAAEFPRTVVGGKARELALLIEQGFLVPPGFVITTEAFRRCGEGEELPEELVAMLTEEHPRAFRSSAVAEDSAHASFAGQYETVLGVCGYDEAVEALRCCWSSARREAVAEYVETISHTGGALAVIVQRMVEADVAGVTFTRNPVTGADEFVIEATRGLGDALMEGAVDPERWIVPPDGSPIREGGPVEVLGEAQVSKLVAVCAEVARLARRPQDIEWAFGNGSLHLLQARPITALPVEPAERPPKHQTWERDDAHFPEPALPLVASSWLPAHARCFEQVAERCGLPFDTVRSGVYGGRVYCRIEPFGDGGTGRDDRKPPPGWVFWLLFRLVPSMRRRLKRAQEALAADLPMALIDEWEAGGRERAEARTRELREVDRTSLTDRELADHLRDVVDHCEAVGLDHFMLTFVSGMATLGYLGRMLERRLGWTMVQTMDLLQGWGEASTEAGQALDRLAATLEDDEEGARLLRERPAALRDHPGPGGSALRAFLDDLGHRPLGPSLDRPLWAEEPMPLLRLLRTRLDDTRPQHDPRSIARGAEKQVREAVDPEEWPEIEVALGRARRARPYQDETEGKLFDAFGVLRYAALEAGARLVSRGMFGDRDAVWFLEIEELLFALRSGECDVDVETRRGELRWARANRLPRTLGPSPSPPPDLPFPSGVDDFTGSIFWVLRSDETGEIEEHEDADWTGLGCSPGEAEGTVRVIRDTNSLHLLQPGDILVCHGTTAAWSVAFGLLAGLITEVGGPLSHPATLAREYGIPGVLGVEGATTELKDGDLVQLDGTTGTVRIVSRNSESAR